MTCDTAKGRKRTPGEFDETARQFIQESLVHDGRLSIVAKRPGVGDAAEYDQKERAQRRLLRFPAAPT